MKRRSNGADASFVIELVFGIMGVIFTLVATIVGLAFSIDGDEFDVFLLIPGVFFLMGLIFLGVCIMTAKSRHKKNVAINELIQNGNYIMAEVVDISRDKHVEINNVHPWRVECEYEDAYGTVYHFTSKNITHNPTNELNPQVRVYVNPDDYSQYYVDVDHEIEPEEYE